MPASAGGTAANEAPERIALVRRIEGAIPEHIASVRRIEGAIPEHIASVRRIEGAIPERIELTDALPIGPVTGL